MIKTTPQLAVQLYTVRDFFQTPDDMKRSLEKISAIGYRAVQLSAVGAMNGETPPVSAESARQMLDDNGLGCIATHRSWDSLKNATEQEIAFHQTLGCDFVAIGSLPGEFRARGADGYRECARQAVELAEQLAPAGLRLGYHNHAFEWEKENGIAFFEVLQSSGVMMELDVYWIAHAGANPQRVVESCAGQIPVVHVKDKAMIGDEAVMAPVGEGNLDWDNLLPALARSGAEFLAVEQDICRRDPFDCLRSSWDFLSAHPALQPKSTPE